MSRLPELQANQRQQRELREISANNEEEDACSDASSDEEMRSGAVAVAGMFTGGTNASVLSEPSLIVAKLAEDSQEDEKL